MRTGGQLLFGISVVVDTSPMRTGVPGSVRCVAVGALRVRDDAPSCESSSIDVCVKCPISHERNIREVVVDKTH